MKLILNVAITTLLFLSLSCRKNVFENQSNYFNNPNYLTKEEATAYLQKHFKNHPTPTFGSAAHGVVDTNRRYNYTNTDIDFDGMRNLPLTNGTNMQVATLKPQQQSCNNYGRLLMAQSHDSVYAYIYEVIVDDSVVALYHGQQDSLQALYNLRRFSGIINVYNLDGRLLRSDACHNGFILNDVITSGCINCAFVPNPHELPEVIVHPNHAPYASNTPTPVYSFFTGIF